MFDEHLITRFIHFHSFFLKLADDYRFDSSGPVAAAVLRGAALDGAAWMVGESAALTGAWEPELAVFV